MAFLPLTVYANNPSTVVSSGGTSAPGAGTVETWTVANSAPFPVVEIGATQFHVADPQLPTELITVQNMSGTTWTVVRGAEGTTPAAHGTGFTVTQVVSAGDLAGMQYPVWQFPVQVYGAQGDGKIGTGGTGASAQAVFTDSGATFVAGAAPAGDVGKVIIINQGTGSATVATNPFCGTITAVNSATSVTLNANLAATCAAAPYIYGTDDAAAITTAITTAAQWAVATGNYKAQVIFAPQNYMLGALVQSTSYQWPPFNTGSNYTYNTHIPIPFAGQFSRKLIIDLLGTGSAADPDFWGAAVPSLQGSCLVSAVFPASQPDATFGQVSVIGTPSTSVNIGNGGISGGAFANVLVNLDGITVVTPYNGQQYGFDFRTAAQLNVKDGSALAFAPVNFGTQTVGGPWLRSSNLAANGVAVGLAMPNTGNNDNNNIGLFSAEGIAIGMQISEHFTAQRIATMYCKKGIAIDPTIGNPAHGGSILFWSCEGGDTGLYASNNATGQYPIFIGNADFEAMLSWYVDDSNNRLTGIMYWNDPFQSAPVTPVGIQGGATLQILNTRMYPGPWLVNATQSIPAAPAAPASATAQQNTAWRPATVYASATTSITGTSVGPASGSLTALGQAAGAGAVIPVFVPGGHWYSVTYTGTLTTKWVLG